MKNDLLAGVICFLLFNSALSAQDSLATDPPFKRFSTLPPVKLLLTDSTTFFEKKDLNKNTPALFILFNPDCKHCQIETDELVKNMDQLKKINVVMVTTQVFSKMKAFYEKYELANFKNVVVGQDIHYFLPVFYDIKNLPFYDKKGNLIHVFEGNMTLQKILAEFNK